MSIYVDNLSYKASQENLNEVFAEYGTVKRVQLPTDLDFALGHSTCAKPSVL